MSQSAHELRDNLVDRMRGSGISRETAKREAEASVRRVLDNVERTGSPGAKNPNKVNK